MAASARFQYPIQCIQHLEGPQPSAQKVFIASAGPKIYSWSAEDGRQLSVWPLDTEIDNGESRNVIEETLSNSSADEPPEKRRKLSLSEQASHSIERRKAGKSWSSIPILVASPTQHYVVAVTGEDKCLRVFSLSENGGLTQISER